MYLALHSKYHTSRANGGAIFPQKIEADSGIESMKNLASHPGASQDPILFYQKFGGTGNICRYGTEGGVVPTPDVFHKPLVNGRIKVPE
jgi:hypothetical protein